LARFKIDFKCWNDKSRMFSFKSRMCLRDGERECVPSSFNVQTNNLEMPAKEFTFTRSLYLSSSSFLSSSSLSSLFLTLLRILLLLVSVYLISFSFSNFMNPSVSISAFCMHLLYFSPFSSFSFHFFQFTNF